MAHGELFMMSWVHAPIYCLWDRWFLLTGRHLLKNNEFFNAYFLISEYDWAQATRSSYQQFCNDCLSHQTLTMGPGDSNSWPKVYVVPKIFNCWLRTQDSSVHQEVVVSRQVSATSPTWVCTVIWVLFETNELISKLMLTLRPYDISNAVYSNHDN